MKDGHCKHQFPYICLYASYIQDLYGRINNLLTSVPLRVIIRDLNNQWSIFSLLGLLMKKVSLELNPIYIYIVVRGIDTTPPEPCSTIIGISITTTKITASS